MAEKNQFRPQFTKTGVTRRKLLIGGTLATGLVVAWTFWPRDYQPNLPLAEDEILFGAYLKIARDGRILVQVPQCEMGQGVYTVLPQILADELGADWRTVAVEPAPNNPIYANAVIAAQYAQALLPPGAKGFADDDSAAAWAIREIATRESFIVTADAASIPAYAPEYRAAGAAARVLLAKAAAARWDVPWESCIVERGMVREGKRELKFGELVEAAAKLDLPDPLPLRPEFANGVVGQDVTRLDMPAKLDGAANFAGDIRRPDMVFAAIRQGPIGDSRLKSYNREGAAGINGLIDVIDGERWLAAVGTNWWVANRALDAMSPVFETTGLLPSSDAATKALDKALHKGEGKRFVSRGDTQAAFAGKISRRAEYQCAPTLHGALETRSAAAEFIDGRLHLWLATQAPADAVRVAARALGISGGQVTLYPMMAGGSFGRALDNQIAAQIAIIARKMARPVQLTYSRVEENLHDIARAPAHARLDAIMLRGGKIEALQIKIAAPPAAREQAKRLWHEQDSITAMRKCYLEADGLAVAGADPPYNIPNVTVDHHPAYIGYPTGNWRSNAHSTSCFFLESFIDELASRTELEPLSFRMAMMQGQPRLARCLTGVAAMAGWDGGRDGSGQGLACHMMDGGAIAVIAGASRSSDGLRVSRISAMVDIGKIYHPDIARQQIEGGLVFGLAMALGSATGYDGGIATARRMSDLALPRLAETPEIQVEFVRSDADPVGPEQIGVPAVAPAIANALFSATGVRYRSLPLFAEEA
ncbi:MAG: molybdopterin cofactor-binding domain-containing protein [Parasphingorhabdus sp.]|nr:molybdopterin cofactor-binding domain-containing protein [Parasphingorhabdus sp.]